MDIEKKTEMSDLIERGKSKGSLSNNDILEMIDIRNGKTVLRVGTNCYDSYYPYFVSEWVPENLYCNTGA